MSDFSLDGSIDGAFAVVGDTTKFADMNKGIQPIFFMESVEDGKATEEAGTLKMKDVEFVRLRVAGDPNSAPVHPVTEEYRQRFAAEYNHWKQTRKNDHIEGTRLSDWPLVSRGFIMELAALGIRSVEDLSVVSDANITRITDGRLWREKAKAWLETNKDAAVAARYAAEAERLRGDNAELHRQIHDLANRIQAIEANKEIGDGTSGRRHRAA